MRRLLSILLALIIGIVTAQAQHFYGFSVQSYRISSVRPNKFQVRERKRYGYYRQ